MKTNFIDTLDDAQAMLDFALQRPLSHIGFDTEFRYDRPGVVIDKRNTAYDPRSIRPLLLSLAMAEPFDDEEGCLYSFVIDLRKPELLPVLKELFRLPVSLSPVTLPRWSFSACGGSDCQSRISSGTPLSSRKLCTWDGTITNTSCRKWRMRFEQIQAKEEAKEKEVFGFSLVATCQRYGVAYRMETEKERLQQSFLIHSDDAQFSEEQIDYAAEDAIAAGLLYPLQVQKAVQHGLLRHCETVEMAWVITNARIEWAGVRVDRKKRDEAIARISVHQERLGKASGR